MRIGGIDITGHEPDEQPCEGGKSGDGEAHDERDAGPVDDARVDVAAEHVGPEPELRGRATSALRRRERRGVDRSEEGREHRHQHQQHEQKPTQGNGRVAAHKGRDPAPNLRWRQHVRQHRSNRKRPLLGR